MQIQTSNALHDVIMEAGGKDRLPMLAPSNYVQWKSRIKRYIDTKPNHELIHYCLKNPPYKFTWADKKVPISEGSSVTTTETYMETYKNVSQDIRDQLNAKTKSIQIILIGIDNDIYSTVDACPNACEMWKAIERLKQGESINVQDLETNLYWEFGKFTSQDEVATRNRGKTIVNSPQPIYDQEPSMVAEDDETPKDKEIGKLMALISLSFKKIYKPTNNNHQTSSNTSRENQDNSLRINRSTGYENQRIGNVAGAKETVVSTVEEAGIQLNAKQADWRDGTDDESEDQEFEAHYIEHSEQSDSIHNIYPIEQDEHNVIIDSLGMSYYREQIDQNDDDDIANERELLASLIKKLKCEIGDSKNRNKFLETSNKVLVEKLKGCYNDNLALMLAPESDEVICLEKESRSKLSDLIKPFNHDKLNNLYDLFVPQREKSSEQRYLSKRSRLSHTHVNNGNSKESFNKQTTLLEKRMDESIPWDQKCKSSKELFKIKRSVGTIFDGVKPGNITTKLYERISKACSWWYPKFTPPGYKWKPKSGKENVNPNVSMPLLVEIVLFIVDSGCSKHMTGNLKLLINFVKKFLGMVKFGNDPIAPILGYGDLVQGAVMIKRVYYIEGLNHNLFFVGQFCDADLEVAFRKSTCYIRDLKGNDLLTGLKMKYLKFSLNSSGLSKEDFMLKTLHQTSVARTPEQNDIVKRRDHTLVEAARTMLSTANKRLKNMLKVKMISLSTSSVCRYVNQLDGFVDPYHPDKVFRLKKALYGLKQTPRAWGDILLVQIHVDDIIFGFTNPKLSKQFEKLMHSKFEMSMMEELKFFLGIRIHQSPCGFFINQAKYAQEILIKHDHVGYLDSRKSTSGGIQFLGGEVSQLVVQKAGLHFNVFRISRAAIAISCNPVQHSRTKHIDVRYHFVKEKFEKGIVELFFIGTEYQLADLFTKALLEERFKYLVRRLGMRCLTPEELEVLENESA
nr:integrase, catalytic region, zinc finger, CCHC-type, peptidase aspartic, catalytic [Tanacetum cinerariifolium]